MGWFKRSEAPQKNPENPGDAVTMTIATSNGVESRTEQVDMVELLDRVLAAYGYRTKRHDSWLVERETGMTLAPLLVSFQPLDDMGASSTTTIECRHAGQLPGGVFEYQHASGDNFEASILDGFDKWVQLDLVPLVDSFRDKPADCTMMEMDFPAKDGRPALSRRAILGPVMAASASPGAGADQGGEHSPGCPCCLLTNTLEAFQELIEQDRFFGIRLFAMRDQDGAISADCRVNGEDWDAGEEALVNYAKTWPGDDFEFRKQYVVLKTGGDGADRV